MLHSFHAIETTINTVNIYIFCYILFLCITKAYFNTNKSYYFAGFFAIFEYFFFTFDETTWKIEKHVKLRTNQIQFYRKVTRVIIIRILLLQDEIFRI